MWWGGEGKEEVKENKPVNQKQDFQGKKRALRLLRSKETNPETLFKSGIVTKSRHCSLGVGATPLFPTSRPDKTVGYRPGEARNRLSKRRNGGHFVAVRSSPLGDGPSLPEDIVRFHTAVLVARAHNRYT